MREVCERETCGAVVAEVVNAVKNNHAFVDDSVRRSTGIKRREHDELLLLTRHAHTHDATCENDTAMDTDDVGMDISCEDYEKDFLSFVRRVDPPGQSLADLAAAKINESFDDVKTLIASLQHILPRSVLETVRNEHLRSCVEVVLKYYYHEGKLYCFNCTPVPWDSTEASFYDDFERTDPSVTMLGPMQISNMSKLKARYMCCVCKWIPYFHIVRLCMCDIILKVNDEPSTYRYEVTGGGRARL